MQRAVAGVAAVLLAFASCRSRPELAAIRIAHESDIISLDPVAQQESVTNSVLSNVCEALASFDRDMTLRPALAVTWSTPDENTWLIQLHPGVRFHDGRPLTAADVKYSLDRARGDPVSVIKGLLASIDAVEVVDPTTVRLRTRSVDPLLMNRLSYVRIVPDAGARYDATRIVGTGPYRLVRWQRGSVVEVEAFDGYWGGRPAIDRVRFVPVQEGAASIAALRGGQVDVLRWVPENMADELNTIPSVRLLARAGLATYYLWMNTREGARGARNPFADRRVRQALSLAIDRSRIIEALHGYGAPAYQLVQPGVFGFIPDLPPTPANLREARGLLKEAGYPDGFETTLVHRPQATMSSVAGLVQDMLGQVGIRLKLDAPPWPEVVAGWDNARIPFFLGGWFFEDGDASGFLRQCLFTRDPVRKYGLHNAGYSDPRLDRLIEENSRILGEAKRLQQYRQIMRFAMEEMPVVPLYHKMLLYGVSTKVRWEPRLDGKLLAAEMSFAPAD